MWKAEQLINQTTDERVWKAEREAVDRLDSIQWNMLFDQFTDTSQEDNRVTPIYDFSFYVNNRYHSVQSAKEILTELFQRLPHRSVVDFGCGIGSWLWVSRSLGAKDITGYDGDYVPESLLMIPKESFAAVDLEKPVCIKKKYDLAMSMEVAEHLHVEVADQFVKTLCDSADTVLFSAAHPGQGGDGHLNEQPKEYWIEKFERNGFHAVEISAHFRNNEKIESWYRQNVVLFTVETNVESLRSRFSDWQ